MDSFLEVSKKMGKKYIRRVHKNMYDIPFGGLCGILVDEVMMKKIAKLEYRFVSELKDLLINNKDRLEISSWGLAYPNCKQTTFRYIGLNTGKTIDDRINLIRNLIEIKKCEHLYETNMEWSMKNKEKLNAFAQKDMEMLGVGEE